VRTKQRNSFVENSSLEAKGVPTGLEKTFLESLGDLVPDEVMNGEAVMAHSSNPDTVSDRRNQRKALKLLKDVGWTVGDDGKFVDAEGKPIAFKIMLSSSTGDTVEAIITTYVQTLNKWGISAEMEKIDSAQYASRYYDKDWASIGWPLTTCMNTLKSSRLSRSGHWISGGITKRSMMR